MNDLLRVSYKLKMKDTNDQEHWPMCTYVLYAEVETQTKTKTNTKTKMPESDLRGRGRTCLPTIYPNGNCKVYHRPKENRACKPLIGPPNPELSSISFRGVETSLFVFAALVLRPHALSRRRTSFFCLLYAPSPPRRSSQVHM